MKPIEVGYIGIHHRERQGFLVEMGTTTPNGGNCYVDWIRPNKVRSEEVLSNLCDYTTKEPLV